MAFAAKRAKGEGGFTLIEIMAAILMLTIVGALVMQLTLVLIESRELTVRYEQIALSARTAAERILEAFHESDGALPELCGAGFVHLDPTLDVRYECRWMEEEGGTPETGLYEISIWLRRKETEAIVGDLTMMAVMGGYM